MKNYENQNVFYATFYSLFCKCGQNLPKKTANSQEKL